MKCSNIVYGGFSMVLRIFNGCFAYFLDPETLLNLLPGLAL